MIKDQRPNFLLIQETKMKRDLVNKISFSKTMCSDASDLDRASGGVLILYNSRAFKLSSIYNADNALLCEVSHIHSNDSWFILNLYAPNSKRERKSFWDKMHVVIINNNVYKGIIMGEFNSPLSNSDKRGGLALDQDNKLDLSIFIHNLAFMDMDLQGGSYTWYNRRVGGECI